MLSTPEQTLSKLSGGHIVYCKINGIDSTSLMKSSIPEYNSGEFIYSPQSITGSGPGKSDFFNGNFDDGNGHNHFFIAEFKKGKNIFSINRHIKRFIPTYNGSYQDEYRFNVIKLTSREFKIRINSKDKEYEVLIGK
ncbi:MAG: hypothetical protein Fur0023_12170 [Bacteroidia bacterium]